MLLVASGQGQEAVPLRIELEPGGPEHKVTLSWSTIPGRTYEIRTRDALTSPWINTNPAPVRAQSTQTSLTQGIEPAVLARFFGIRAQPVPVGNSNAITSATVTELEKVLGLTFTPEQRSRIQSGLAANRNFFEAMRKNHLLNSDAPPLLFDPVPPGVTLETEQEPITWSAPKHLTVPSNRADLAFYSVRDLGELIHTRQITSTELTELYLDRLRRYGPTLRCVITLTRERALEQAARADQELAAGKDRGPLHGVPYGIKDLFAAKGYPTTWGAAQFKDQVIEEDATVVTKLEEAGAVLVAKLSTGELAFSDEWFGGVTLNPWNLSESSWGSSAGPASATAAGLVAFSIGTETFGSIVAPSTRCRVTGLRSTFGRISRTGGMNISWSMDKIGPICRDVEDCAIVLDAILGPDGLDHAARDVAFNYAPHMDLKTLKVGYRRGGLSTVILDRLATLVGREQLVEVTLPNNSVDAAWLDDIEAASCFDEMTRFGADTYLTSQSHWRDAFPLARAVPAVEYLQAQRLRQKLILDMAALMRRIDVLVSTDSDLLSFDVKDARHIMNLTSQPCVLIPHGAGTGLGFTGRVFEEATILALAKAYQDITPYHTNRPSGFVR